MSEKLSFPIAIASLICICFLVWKVNDSNQLLKLYKEGHTLDSNKISLIEKRNNVLTLRLGDYMNQPIGTEMETLPDSTVRVIRVRFTRDTIMFTKIPVRFQRK